MYRHRRFTSGCFAISAASSIVVLAVAACGESAVAPVVEPGPPRPARLAFLTQPRDAAAGAAISPAVRVAVLDAAGNLASGTQVAITIALADNPGGATLGGDRTAVSAGGIAEFDALTLETAASGYTLTASAPALGSATSDAFEITPAAAARLAILTQPDTVEGLVPFGTALEVAVRDEFGNLVPDAAATVSLALAVNPTGRTDMSEMEGLAGTVLDATDGGVAVFPDLRIGLPGSGWVIQASADGLEPALSEGITVRLTFERVIAGFAHACGLTVANYAYCWGTGALGRLGNGTFTDRPTPTPVATTRRFDDLTIGRDHTCAREADSEDMWHYCWGSNYSGQLGTGDGQQAQPEPVIVVASLPRVDAGSFHTCGTSNGGSAFCWGSNQSGALGDGTTVNRTTPAAVSGDVRFRQVRGGNTHTCGVTNANEAYCWGGQNQHGEVGDGTTQQRLVPTAVTGGIEFSSVVAGGAFSCGLDTDGAAWCWGHNEDGRVGDGTAISRTSPVAVAGGLTFTRLESGVSHTCGLTDSGTAWCWGRNDSGWLGDGTTQERHQPTPVAGGLSFVQLSVGTRLTCGLTADGSAYCWGRNADGQVGDGTTEDRFTPTRVVQ